MARGQSRERLLQEGLELFRTGSFASTGVQEIATASEVPKGSFYNYFSSKTDFGVKVVEKFTDEACELLEKQLFQGPGTALERLRGMYVSWIDQIRTDNYAKGCLVGRLCQEMGARCPDFRQALDFSVERMESCIEKCLIEAQDEGQLAADRDPAMLARFIYAAWQGAMLRVRVVQSDRPLKEFMTVIFGTVLK